MFFIKLVKQHNTNDSLLLKILLINKIFINKWCKMKKVCYNNFTMKNSKQTKYQIKKDVKRRLISLCILIPFGVGFAILFYTLNLAFGLQLLFTVLSWGAVYLLYEVCYSLIKKQIEKKTKQKPHDPFAD